MLPTSTLALTIPEPAHAGNIPVGWAAFQIAPLIEESEWEELDDVEGRLRAIAGWIESYKGDALEVEKALRLVEYRRGTLLGPRQPGSRKSQPLTRVLEVDASAQTMNRWRKIADNWVSLIWPHIMAATRKSEVTQAQVLRLISQNGSAPPAPAKVKEADATKDAIEAAEGMTGELEDEVDPLAEWERAEKENERLTELNEQLAGDDTGKALIKTSTMYSQLEGRLNQEMATRSEAEKEAKYAKSMLAKVRFTLEVKGDRDIISAIQNLQTEIARAQPVRSTLQSEVK